MSWFLISCLRDFNFIGLLGEDGEIGAIARSSSSEKLEVVKGEDASKVNVFW